MQELKITSRKLLTRPSSAMNKIYNVAYQTSNFITDTCKGSLT